MCCYFQDWVSSFSVSSILGVIMAASLLASNLPVPILLGEKLTTKRIFYLIDAF